MQDHGRLSDFSSGLAQLMVGLGRGDGLASREWHHRGLPVPAAGCALQRPCRPTASVRRSRGCPRGVDRAEEEKQHYEDLAALQHATVLDGHGGQFGVRAGHGDQFAK